MKLLSSFVWNCPATASYRGALVFCMTLRLMSKYPPDDVARPCLSPGFDRNNPQQSPRQELRVTLVKRLSEKLTVQAPFTRPQDLHSIKYGQAMEAVGIFSILLREALVTGNVQEVEFLYGTLISPPPPVAEISIPTTEDIDFQRRMMMPLPFSLCIYETISTCHLPMMATKSYLTEGEWTGFYCKSFGPRTHNPCFDPAMRNIHFTARDEANTEDVSLEARGEDGIGSFKLSGRMTPKSGRIVLGRSYDDNGPRRLLSCVMTPVGIVGTWGHTEYGGWIWLWKTQGDPQ